MKKKNTQESNDLHGIPLYKLRELMRVYVSKGDMAYQSFRAHLIHERDHVPPKDRSGLGLVLAWVFIWMLAVIKIFV